MSAGKGQVRSQKSKLDICDLQEELHKKDMTLHHFQKSLSVNTVHQSTKAICEYDPETLLSSQDQS